MLSVEVNVLLYFLIGKSQGFFDGTWSLLRTFIRKLKAICENVFHAIEKSFLISMQRLLNREG